MLPFICRNVWPFKMDQICTNMKIRNMEVENDIFMW